MKRTAAKVLGFISVLIGVLTFYSIVFPIFAIPGGIWLFIYGGREET